jgi:hypothetical protein
LRISDLHLGDTRIGRIDDEGEDACLRQQLPHQLKPLWQDFHIQLSCAGYVAARSRQVGDETKVDRVATGGEDNRDRRGGRFCRKCCGRTGGCNDDHAPADQVGRQFRQPAVLALCPSVFDKNILTFDKSCLVKAPTELVHESRVARRYGTVEEANHRHCRLLRSRSQRNCSQTTEQTYEVAPPHWPLRLRQGIAPAKRLY